MEHMISMAVGPGSQHIDGIIRCAGSLGQQPSKSSVQQGNEKYPIQWLGADKLGAERVRDYCDVLLHAV